MEYRTSLLVGGPLNGTRHVRPPRNEIDEGCDFSFAEPYDDERGGVDHKYAVYHYNSQDMRFHYKGDIQGIVTEDDLKREVGKLIPE